MSEPKITKRYTGSAVRGSFRLVADDGPNAGRQEVPHEHDAAKGQIWTVHRHKRLPVLAKGSIRGFLMCFGHLTLNVAFNLPRTIKVKSCLGKPNKRAVCQKVKVQRLPCRCSHEISWPQSAPANPSNEKWGLLSSWACQFCDTTRGYSAYADRWSPSTKPAGLASSPHCRT